MAITLRFRLLYSLLLCVGPYHHIISLFGLLAIPIARAQVEISVRKNSESCEGETCSWENEGQSARERLLTEWKKSDHLECDVSKLGLSPERMKKIETILSASVLNNERVIKMADSSNFLISPHMVYRYLNSVDFADNYHGQRIEDAILSTVTWRHQFGVTTIDVNSFSGLVKKGLGYTSNQFDKHGRAIIYLKIGRNDKLESPEVYRNLLMYTVERADRMSVQGGSGQFVAVVDLSGFTWATCPSISMIKESIGLLKKHYPYRLGGVFVVNGGATFNFLWSMVKPIMPKRALMKTFVLNKKEEYTVLNEKIGIENLEVSYGGDLIENHGNDLGQYFRLGYWHSESVGVEDSLAI